MKLLSILLVLFVISQVFGGYSRCLKKFKGKVCNDERECSPYGSCQMVGSVWGRAGLMKCVCHKTKKEAKECDYYDDENKLCSEYSGTEYSYDMEEDNFDKEMPLKIPKE